MFVSIITAISIVFIWGASLIAESSNPWDTLYPVKISVNESVQSALTFWSESEAELQLSFIEERIKEKNQLESEGELTIDLESEIEKSIQSHVNIFNSERVLIDSETASTSNLDIKFSSLVSLFWDNINIDTTATASSDTEVSSDDSSTESSSESEAEVQAEWSINIDWFVDAMNDTSAEIMSQWEAQVNWIVDATIDTQAQIEAGIDSSVDTVIDAVNDISVSSDTSISNSTNTTASSEIVTEADTSINSSSSADIGDTSITTDASGELESTTWLGVK